MRFARFRLVLVIPCVLLVAHGLLADGKQALVFGFDGTWAWPLPLRWAWLGLGLATAASGALRRWIRNAVSATKARLERSARPWRIGMQLAAASVVLWCLRCQNFYLGDSFHLIRAIPRGLRLHWNEPLAILLPALLYRVLAPLGIGPTAELAYVPLSIGAGLVYLFLPGRIARTLELRGDAYALFVGMMLSCGAVELYFGYAESYTLCSLLLVLFLAAGATRLVRGTGVALPAFFAGLAVCFHPLTLALGPSLLYLAWHQPRVTSRLRSLAAATAAYLLPIALLVLGMTMAGHGLSYFWKTDSPGGVDRHLFVPLWQTSTYFEHVTLFSLQHLLDVVNELFLISPLGLPMLLLGSWRTSREQSPPPPFQAAVVVFFELATAGMVLFLLVWNPDLGAARDWDLFAPAAFPLTALATYLLATRLAPKDLKDAAVLYPLCSMLVVLPWIGRNSVRAIPPATMRF